MGLLLFKVWGSNDSWGSSTILGGFTYIFFQPDPCKKWSNLTSIFFRRVGKNHQPVLLDQMGGDFIFFQFSPLFGELGGKKPFWRSYFSKGWEKNHQRVTIVVNPYDFCYPTRLSWASPPASLLMGSFFVFPWIFRCRPWSCGWNWYTCWAR